MLFLEELVVFGKADRIWTSLIRIALIMYNFVNIVRIRDVQMRPDKVDHSKWRGENAPFFLATSSGQR